MRVFNNLGVVLPPLCLSYREDDSNLSGSKFESKHQNKDTVGNIIPDNNVFWHTDLDSRSVLSQSHTAAIACDKQSQSYENSAQHYSTTKCYSDAYHSPGRVPFNKINKNEFSVLFGN